MFEGGRGGELESFTPRPSQMLLPTAPAAPINSNEDKT